MCTLLGLSLDSDFLFLKVVFLSHRTLGSKNILSKSLELVTCKCSIEGSGLRLELNFPVFLTPNLRAESSSVTS